MSFYFTLLRRSLHVLRLVGMTIVFILLSPTIAHAANFTTDYHVTYNAQDDGITHAVLDITLTNTTTQFYASSYKMQLGFDEIENLTITDAEGPIQPKLEKTGDGYTLHVNFNKHAVGKDTKQPFTVEFDTPSVAKRYGRVWEINIPGIANPDDFTSFVVDVKTPTSFGSPTYIKPNQPSKRLTFTKEQLGKSGIAIAFGDTQIYAFNLSYHLDNNKPYPVTKEIALPPSTNYQDVYITAINPEPDNVTIDTDGNWLATYSLLPSQRLDIAVAGKAEVSLEPKQQELSLEDRVLYLAEQPYWETSNPEIRALAEKLKTPEAIYHYVVSTLKYDFSRVTDDKDRLGAVKALAAKESAVCLEFTDLFIAIARAAGIPAREVDGFAYTENAQQRPLSLVQDILHAWPEYYDTERKTWIMVDPTWGSTTGGIDYFSTLDIDHFALAIKGVSSSDPIPAGGYKISNNKEIKDISVAFAEEIAEKSQDVTISSTIPEKSMGGFPLLGEVSVRNVGTGLISSQVMYVSSEFLTPHDQVFTLKPIPPFGHTTVNLGFHATPLLSNHDARFTVKLGDEQSGFAEKIYTHQVHVLPIYLTVWGVAAVIFILVLTFVLVVLRQSRRLRQ